MRAKRAGKGAPMALRWQRLLQQCREVPDDNPSGQAVVAIAAVLVSHADPDGRHCRPAIDTVVREARASKRTALLALAWLTEHGWLEVTRKVSRRPTEYRLIIPVGADEHLPDGSSWVPTSTYQGNSVGAVVGAVVGAREHHDLLTSESFSEGEEDEEEGVTPVAGAPVAPPEAVGGIDVQAIASDIAAAVGASIGLERLGPALVGAKTRTGWGNEVLATYCVVKLRHNEARVREPSAFLATDLDLWVNAETVPSPRMILAAVEADLDAVDRTREVEAAEEGRVYHYEAAIRFDDRLIQAGLIKDDGRARPRPWDVKEADVERFTQVARSVLFDFRHQTNERSSK